MLEGRTGTDILLIEMPPRHGKSWLISQYFPAWYLGSHPDHRLILASYGADFARSWGRKARDLLSQFGSWFGDVRVSDSQAAAGDWETNQGGGMMTAGAGGPLTGRGGNCAYFSCKCMTRSGMFPLSQIKVGEEVWAYDHEREDERW